MGEQTDQPIKYDPDYVWNKLHEAVAEARDIRSDGFVLMAMFRDDEGGAYVMTRHCGVRMSTCAKLLFRESHRFWRELMEKQPPESRVSFSDFVLGEADKENPNG